MGLVLMTEGGVEKGMIETGSHQLRKELGNCWITGLRRGSLAKCAAAFIEKQSRVREMGGM